MSRGPRVRGAATVWALTLAVGLLLTSAASPRVRAQPPGTAGTGIFLVDGPATRNLTLTRVGTYYLGVGTNDSSSSVGASLYYNASLLAQENGSVAAFNVVSLPAGNYSLALHGSGRAALAWDFTNGSFQAFPDNESLVAFLTPQGPEVNVSVSMGDAQRISLGVYDASLRLVANFTASANGNVTVNLPAGRSRAAYLAATVDVGNPAGLFGLSWTSQASAPPPLDFFAWPLFLLWIVVPIVIAAVVLAIRGQRRRRERLRG